MRPKDTTPNIREYCEALRKMNSFGIKYTAHGN